jgi:hypothetical protein
MNSVNKPSRFIQRIVPNSEPRQLRAMDLYLEEACELSGRSAAQRTKLRVKHLS